MNTGMFNQWYYYFSNSIPNFFYLSTLYIKSEFFYDSLNTIVHIIYMIHID